MKCIWNGIPVMLQKQEIIYFTCGEREIECKENILPEKDYWKKWKGKPGWPQGKKSCRRKPF
jgi:hypothetical protein